ncbi:Uncharacterized protein SCF082_LOCUS1298 [Durusdinium trenchii]|uniref:Uncharacterized protein n=1 Tax=Durusdinium trenchii TaxID=1381693 RepID=A0ABP0HDW6_9DINO
MKRGGQLGSWMIVATVFARLPQSGDAFLWSLANPWAALIDVQHEPLGEISMHLTSVINSIHGVGRFEFLEEGEFEVDMDLEVTMPYAKLYSESDARNDLIAVATAPLGLIQVLACDEPAFKKIHLMELDDMGSFCKSAGLESVNGCQGFPATVVGSELSRETSASSASVHFRVSTGIRSVQHEGHHFFLLSACGLVNWDLPINGVRAFDMRGDFELHFVNPGNVLLDATEVRVLQKLVVLAVVSACMVFAWSGYVVVNRGRHDIVLQAKFAQLFVLKTLALVLTVLTWTVKAQGGTRFVQLFLISTQLLVLLSVVAVASKALFETSIGHKILVHRLRDVDAKSAARHALITALVAALYLVFFRSFFAWIALLSCFARLGLAIFSNLRSNIGVLDSKISFTGRRLEFFEATRVSTTDPRRLEVNRCLHILRITRSFFIKFRAITLVYLVAAPLFLSILRVLLALSGSSQLYAALAGELVDMLSFMSLAIILRFRDVDALLAPFQVDSTANEARPSSSRGESGSFVGSEVSSSTLSSAAVVPVMSSHAIEQDGEGNATAVVIPEEEGQEDCAKAEKLWGKVLWLSTPDKTKYFFAITNNPEQQ